MGTVMYGMSPTPWETDPIVPVPRRVLPDQTLPWYPPQTGAGEIGREVVVGPAAPETAEAVQGRIAARVLWLKNELRQHEAWRAELALLEKMLAAAAPEPTPTGGTE